MAAPVRRRAPADPGRELHRLAVAAALGRLHRAGADLDLPPRPRLRPIAELAWPPAVAIAELGAPAAALADVRSEAIAAVAAIARERRPPSGVIHGDVFKGNVLMAGDRVAALLDWEEAQADWLVWDLAIAAGALCTAGDDLDRPAVARFLSAYREAGGPSRPGDDVLVEPLVRVKRILAILRAPTDRRPLWDHQARNLRSFALLATGA